MAVKLTLVLTFTAAVVALALVPQPVIVYPLLVILGVVILQLLAPLYL